MRRSAKISPVVFILAIPLVVIVFAVFVLVSRRSSVGDAEAFPFPTYRRDAESLRGNTYLVKGQIESRIAYADGKGGVFSVRLLDASEGRLPVFIPESVRGNIEIGQRYDMRVEVRRDRLTALALEKL